MIFDCEYVTKLVLEWQVTKDTDLLERVFMGCNTLVEVIVSSYDYNYREDLIQEAHARILYALPYFSPRVSTLHNFLTTVIRNMCATYLKKNTLYEGELDIDLYEYEGQTDYIDEEDILNEVIIRNRKRFKSIPTKVIDDATEIVINSLLDGDGVQHIISELIKLGLTKYLARVLYESILVYLRIKNITCANPSMDVNELSILPDFKEFLGDRLYQAVVTVFGGMYIRIPK